MPRATRTSTRKKQPEPEPEPEPEVVHEELDEDTTEDAVEPPTEEELVASIHEEWEKMEAEPEPEVVDLTKDNTPMPQLIKVKGYPKSEPGYREDGLYEEGFIDALRENGHELIDLTAPGKGRKLLYLGIRAAAGQQFEQILKDTDAFEEIRYPNPVYVVLEEQQMIRMVMLVAGVTLTMDRLLRYFLLW